MTQNITTDRKKIKGRNQYDFAFLPRKLIPSDSPIPIAHRHTSENRKFVTPLEMSIIMSIITSARYVWKGQNHLKAFAYGGNGIKKRIAVADEHKERVIAVDKKRKAGATAAEAPYPPKQEFKRDEAVKRDGKNWYRFKADKLKKEKPPDVIEITISPYQLLKQAKLKPANHFAKLNDNLFNRLCEPIANMPPPLLSWERTAENKLLLRISGTWLEDPYDEIPFPLPISPKAASLWIFNFSTVKSRAEYAARNNRNIKINDGDVTIRFVELCRRLGIPHKHGTQYLNNQLHDALAIVNKNLANVSEREVGRFVFNAQNDGEKVWIVARPLGDVQPEESKPKPKPRQHKPKPGGLTPREKRVIKPEVAIEPIETMLPEPVTKPEEKMVRAKVDLDEIMQCVDSLPINERGDEWTRLVGALNDEQRIELNEQIESDRLMNKLKNQRANFDRGSYL